MTRGPNHTSSPCRVGVFRAEYPIVSETFITAQTASLSRYRPTMVVHQLTGPTAFDTVELSRRDRSGVTTALQRLLRWPGLLPNLDRLAGLSLLHAHFGPDGVLALPLARHLGVPLAVTFHGYDATIASRLPAHAAWFSQHPFLRQEPALQRHGRRFIAVSRFIAAKLVERGYAPERIVQHYIGVPTDEFLPRPRDARQRYVLCVGRHVEKKGIAALLQAFALVAANHPDVTLVQVGSGPDTPALLKLADGLGLGRRVRWLGALPHSETLPLMAGAEVFALTSQTASNGDSEGLGMVFNEAAAHGVPALGTRHGGIPEAVIDGETGLLAPERDVAGIAWRLNFLLANPEHAERLGRAGRRFVCDQFDLHRQTHKLEAHYDRIIDASLRERARQTWHSEPRRPESRGIRAELQ